MGTIKDQYGDLPGGPGVKTLHVHCRATAKGLIAGQRKPHGLAKKQKKKLKRTSMTLGNIHRLVGGKTSSKGD